MDQPWTEQIYNVMAAEIKRLDNLAANRLTRIHEVCQELDIVNAKLQNTKEKKT